MWINASTTLQERVYHTMKTPFNFSNIDTDLKTVDGLSLNQPPGRISLLLTMSPWWRILSYGG